MWLFFFSSRRRHTRCALVTGVQTCALPISDLPAHRWLNFIYAEMLTRLSVRDNEKPETARKRFDGQLAVHAWARPGHDMDDPEPRETAAPCWWKQAEAYQSAAFFMEMARATGLGYVGNQSEEPRVGEK